MRGDAVKRRHKVVIVDDHPIVREGFARLLSGEEDLLVVGTAEDAAGALELVEAEKPDLILLDLALKGSNGLELIKDLRVRNPDTAILVVTLHDESIFAERALKAGARGFITKAEATETVLDAIREVLNGEIYTNRRIRTQIMETIASRRRSLSADGVHALSDRELEVFQEIGEGSGTREIAAKLGLSVKTIETYRAHIKTKLGIRDAAELSKWAVEWNIRNRGSAF